LTILTGYVHRAERGIAHHATFVVGSNDAQRQQAVLTQLLHQVSFVISPKGATQQSINTRRIYRNFYAD
jgi:hypothetical protein